MLNVLKSTLSFPKKVTLTLFVILIEAKGWGQSPNYSPSAPSLGLHWKPCGYLPLRITVPKGWTLSELTLYRTGTGLRPCANKF